MTAPMREILSIDTDQALLLAALLDKDIGIERRPKFALSFRKYYSIYFADTHRDASFCVLLENKPVLTVLCTRSPGNLDYYGMPVQFFAAEQADETSVKLAFSHLDKLAAEGETPRIRVTDEGSLGSLSPVGKACLDRRFRPEVSLTAYADLSEGEAGLRRSLRKSYKSLLNWGRANQSIAIVNAANPDRKLFDLYQHFHLKVAGRSTRPQATWDANFQTILEGGAELILGFLPGDDLVAATLIYDAEGTACYGSGVYDRDRFELPLAHWPLWLSMLRAHERGQRRFELGAVPPAGMASGKEVAIGYFKRGFASEIDVSLIWTSEPAGQSL